MLDTLTGPRARAVLAATLFFSVGSVVFANQAYMKLCIEFQSIHSSVTRILNRMEEMDGYSVGKTKIAVIGNLSDSPSGATRSGFERLEEFDATRGTLALSTREEFIYYVWQILGYPANFISTYEMDLLSEEPEIQALPCFPDGNCVTFFHNILVIRLS